MDAAINLFIGNRSPSLLDTIEVDGAALDLTGCSVKLQMRLEGSTTLKVDAAATVVQTGSDPNFVNKGVVRYDWASNDVNTAGEYVAWWQVTVPGSKLLETPEFQVVIWSHSPVAGNLCTVADVRMSAGLRQANRAPDPEIQEMVSTASALIEQHCARELHDVTPGGTPITRRFRVRCNIVDLMPFDLRSASTVTLDPGGSPRTLAADVDYTLEPIPAPEGTYTRVRLSSQLVVGSTQTATRFGYTLLDVNGLWGMAAVPATVRRACVVTVRSWLLRDSSAFATISSEALDTQPSPEVTYELPLSARRMLTRFTRGYA